MPITGEQNILIKSGDATAAGKLHLLHYSLRERILRALKILGACWAGAVGLALTFIPVVHVFGALGLLVTGVVLALQRYHTATGMDRITGPCPACHRGVTIMMEARDRLPKWTYCPDCRAALQLAESSIQPEAALA